MSTDRIILKWKRPKTVAYPKVWYTFQARDLNSDDLVEYRIEDATQSIAADILKHMKSFFMRDEPISQVLVDSENFELYYEDYKRVWVAMIEQKIPMICYRVGSDEIVGVSMNFIISKEDHFMEQFMKTSKSDVMRNKLGLYSFMHQNFDPFKHYGVDEFMASYGLSVDPKYRGRKIGDHFLEARKLSGKQFGIKLAHTAFSSDFSSKNADRVGFESNVVIKYEDVAKIRREMSLKTLLF